MIEGNERPPPSGNSEPERAPPSHTGKSLGLPIVGVVASAGGLEAVGQLLTGLPADTGAAYVLVPHLDPHHDSLMVELLAKRTSMPVLEALDGTRAQPNRVYVIPPNKYLTIRGGVLRLSGPVDRSSTSIDSFLRSLAEDQHEKAIGIVLSGTGSHGAQGLREIKASGGLTMVQDPQTAEFPGMPSAAIATGVVDYILPVQQMPAALLDYVRESYFRQSELEDESPDAVEKLDPILELLRNRMRHDFSCYRKKTLLRRVERRMGLSRVHSVAEYARLVSDDPAEFKRLAKDLLISVTNFFRDPEAAHVLSREVLPGLLRNKGPDEAVRIWVPACATGEEAYSLGMLFLEALDRAGGESGAERRLQVFATDVDEDALAVARQGIYPESIGADVGAQRLERFFSRVDEHSYQVTKRLRETVTFAPQNLISDAPFSKMDLISCRNLLIYLEPLIQQRLIALFHFALNEGGCLVLGSSETIGRRTDLFEPISKKWRVYRRLGAARGIRSDAPFFPADARRMITAGEDRALVRPPQLAELTQRLLLAEYAPAAALVNQSGQVQYFFGPTMRFLEQPTGEPTRDLLAMARTGLHSRLKSALQRAIAEQAVIVIDDAYLQREGIHQRVKLAVRPVSSARLGPGLFLVTFEDLAQGPAAEAAPAASDRPLISEIERELDTMRADLHSTIEELEASNDDLKAANEEMTAMNEELQSVNEELETSREELQSLNEELTTVNGQLGEKVDEVESANNDLANLLNGTDTATLFLSEDYRIRRFTPAATQLFHLIPTDVGRPIGDLSHSFLDGDLQAGTDQVMAHLTPLEKEVEAADGRWFLRRILPYRTLDNRIDGVVVTFADVTSLKREEVALRRNRELQRLATVVTDSNDAITVQQLDGTIICWNRGAEQMYGCPEAEALGLNARQFIPERARPRETEMLARVARGEAIKGWQTQRQTRAGEMLEIDLTATALYDENARLVAISTTERDVSESKRMERQMGRLAAIVASSADAVVGQTLEGVITDWNTGAEQTYGYAAEEIVGQRVSLLSPSERREEIPQLLQQVRDGAAVSQFETVGLCKDGRQIDIVLTISPIRDADGQIVGASAISHDMTQRKNLERQVLEIADEERSRIGHDLHDQIGQELTGLGLLAETLADSLGTQGSTDCDLARRIAAGLKQAILGLRAASRGLIPVEINSGGLMSALAQLADRISVETNVKCLFSSADNVLVDDNVIATHLYRIAQEAVTNALKHGQPKVVRIELGWNADFLTLQVADDGQGLKPHAGESAGLGQPIMRYRAKLIGAVLSIESTPSGVRVRCILPRIRLARAAPA